MKPAHTLFTIAEQADARLTATIAARTDGKRDRWTMTAADMLCPEIREAYKAKLNADEAWLTFLRHDSEQRTANRHDSSESAEYDRACYQASQHRARVNRG